MSKKTAKKLFKKVIAELLTLALVVSGICFVPPNTMEVLAEGEETNESTTAVTADTSWYDADSDATEFVITSAAELYGVATLVNGGTDTFAGKTIKLGADIDVNPNWDASAETVTAPVNVWTPIGSSASTAFQGTFDGQEHTIRGIYVNASSGYVGLFGYAYNSTIQNFRLINSYFTGTASGIGSIVGVGDGNLANIYSDATISGTIVSAGGLIASVSESSNTDTACTITNCWYAGDIISTSGEKDMFAAGLVGYAINGTTTISSCLYTGTINATSTTTTTSAYLCAGGFVGRSNASRTVTISDSLSAGESISATATGTATILTASIIARSQGKLSISENNSVYALDTCAISVGAGTVTGGVITTLSIEQLTGYNSYINASNLSFYTDSNTDIADCYWVVQENDIPVLRSFAGDWIEAGWYYGNTTEGKPYVISTVREFYVFAKLVNEGVDTFAGKEVRLGADIDLNPGWDAYAETLTVPDNVWTPIGNSADTAFQGTFDGQGHSIRGIYVNASSGYVGLFGYAYDSNIQNFCLENSYYTGTASGIGSIVGVGDGNLANIYSDATISGTIASTGGLIASVSHTSNADTACTITNCWYAGEIISTNSAKNIYAGGFVGYVVNGTTTINSCLYTGTIHATSTSTTSGAYLCAGGFVGRSNASRTVTITDSLSAGEAINATATGTATVVTGSIVARSQGALNISADNNVYATDTCATLVGEGSYTGGVITVLSIESLTGYNSYNIASNLGFYTNSDPDNSECYWVTRKDDIPALKSFVEDWIDVGWYYDSTTEDTSYVIGTANELYAFALMVNEGVDTFEGKTVQINADINMNPGWGAYAETISVPDNVWIPIGNSDSTVFRGTFDGQGHDISGIYVDASNGYAGLFGYAYNSTIQNFRLTNSYFTGTASGVGSIVGVGDGNLTNIYSDATINGDFANVGGLIAGVSETSNTNTICTITSCWYDGDVISSNSAKNMYAGGLVGYAINGTTTINSCLYTGSMDVTSTSTTAGAYLCVGGFVGRSNASRNVTISDSLSAGEAVNATATGTATVVTGSIVARSQGTLNISTDNNVYASDVYTNSVGAGSATGGAITILTTEQLTGHVAYNNATNLGFYSNSNADNTGCYWGAREDDVPALKSLTVDWIDVGWYYDDTTDDASYTIYTAEELYGFVAVSKTDVFSGKTVYLGNNITVNEGNASEWANNINIPERSWRPICNGSGYYNGNFDGQGYTISGLYMVTGGQYAGLFRAITKNCTIKNLRLENSYFKSTYTGSTAGFGSIAGLCQGHLNNVYSNAILNCDGYDCGGLAGRVSGTGVTHNFTSCWYDGELTAAMFRCGGIVANVYNGTVNMKYCLNTGKLNNVYNGGSHTFLGGLCGTTTGNGAILNITESISAGEISAVIDKSVGSLVGRVNGSTSTGSTVVLDRVFATKESYGVTIGSKRSVSKDTDGNAIEGTGGIVNGNAFTVSENDRLIGYCKEMIGSDSLTDSSTFTNNWLFRADGVPVPKTFTDLVDSETVLDPTTWDSALGLDYWSNISLKNAVNYGVGNYVISIDTSENTEKTAKQLYDGYLAKLDVVNGDTSCGFALYANNTAGTLDDDGVHNAIYTKGDWVLNVTCVEKMSMVYISVTTSNNFSLSPHMQPVEGTTGTGTVSLTMTDMVIKNGGVLSGNSYVIQLKNGHFIINDGGMNGEMENLIDYLYELKPESDAKPIIEAWTVSHLHNDHFGIMRGLTQELADRIIVEAFYISEPNDSAKLLEGSSFYSGIAEGFENINLLKTSEGTVPEIYRYQTGQRYYFDGVTMDVILGHEQIATSDYPYVNVTDNTLDFDTTSITLLFTTSDGQKIYIGGDSNGVNMDYIMEAYGDNCITLSNIDVFAALNHGKNTVQEETNYFINNSRNEKNATDADGNQIFKFEVVLFPRSVMFKGSESYPLAAEAQQHLCGVTKNYFFISGSGVVNGVSGRVGDVILYFNSQGITQPTVDTLLVASMSAPEIEVDTSAGYRADLTGMQGGYFDGRYYYQAFLKYCYDSTFDDGVDDANNLVVIVKYDVLLKEVVAQSQALLLNHANDITYNSELGYLVVCHNEPNNTTISYLNPTTLEIVQTFTIDYNIFGIDYNATRDKYVLGISNTYGFRVANGDFTEYSDLYSGIDAAQAYTKQTVCCDDNYIYCLYYGNGTNKIDGTTLRTDAVIVYDWSGNFVTIIEVDFGSEEPENISAVDGDLYIATGAEGAAYLYKVSGVVSAE